MPLLTVPLDEQINRLVIRLAAEFTGRVAAALVQQTVRRHYEPLADAPIKAYVATLVERASRLELRRIAGVSAAPGEQRRLQPVGPAARGWTGRARSPSSSRTGSGPGSRPSRSASARRSAFAAGRPLS